jgi:hypothetical protein
VRKCLGASLGDALAKANCFHVSRVVLFIRLPGLGWPLWMSRASLGTMGRFSCRAGPSGTTILAGRADP